MVAIGDQENDLGMFLMAGLSYAMMGAEDCIKNNADRVGPDNNESGVSKIIKELYEGV